MNFVSLQHRPVIFKQTLREAFISSLMDTKKCFSPIKCCFPPPLPDNTNKSLMAFLFPFLAGKYSSGCSNYLADIYFSCCDDWRSFYPASVNITNGPSTAVWRDSNLALPPSVRARPPGWCVRPGSAGLPRWQAYCPLGSCGTWASSERRRQSCGPAEEPRCCARRPRRFQLQARRCGLWLRSSSVPHVHPRTVLGLL